MENYKKFRIITSKPKSGFFASFMRVIGELHYCKKNNIIPAVFFSNNWQYWSPGGFNGSINGWGYYFSPVSDYSASTILGIDERKLEKCNIFDFNNSQIITNSNPKHLKIYDLTNINSINIPKNVTIVNKWPEFHIGKNKCIEENRITAYRLINEFITIHDSVLGKVDEFCECNFKGKNILGVHMRGEEHNKETEGWHGLSFASEKYYMKEIDQYLKHNTNASVFVATDTEKSLSRFIDRYGEKCLYYDAKRATTDSAPHLEYGGADIGEEILIEGLLLSQTNLLIHGISNVAFSVLAFNPFMQHIDIYDKNRTLLKTILKLKKFRNYLIN